MTVRLPLLDRVLARARDLAEQVRETAERVHVEAKEAHRLTAIARRQAETGRELSRAGHNEARAVTDWIKRSGDIAGNGRRYQSDNDETCLARGSYPKNPCC